MKIEKMGNGRYIPYALRGTKLNFADGELSLNLARYQREGTVTKDIMADSEGCLVIGQGLYYIAQVEIPPVQYEETVTVKEQEDGENEGGGMSGSRETVERKPLPLDTDDVILRLFPIDGILDY